MKNAKYVEQNVPKFHTLLNMLKRDILPTTRKPLIAKAIIFIKNKKDGVESLITYLEHVGGLKPISGRENANRIDAGDNVLMLAEVDAKSPYYRYSARTLKDIEGAIAKFNDPTNLHGNKYPVMILHEKYMEGIDLKGVTHVYLVQDPGTIGMFDQIIGRSVRNCSHDGLPKSMWKVNIISLINTENSKHESSPDQLIQNTRQAQIKRVERVISHAQSHSLDCSVSRLRYGLSCVD